MLRLLQGDGTCQNTNSTSDEAKKATQTMKEVPETGKFNVLEKCPSGKSFFENTHNYTLRKRIVGYKK